MASRRPALTQVRLVEDGGQALRREVLHSRRRAALEGDGQDPLTRLSQEGIRREIRHFAQSVQSNMFVLKLGPLDKNDNRIRAVGDEISKIVTNSDVAHLEFQWMFWHL